MVTFESFSLGNTNDVNHFILCKGALDWNFFLKKFTGKLHLIRNGTTIDLDFHNVCLLLAPSQNGLLSMENSTDNLAIFFDLRNLFLNFFLASIIFPLKTSLCKGLLLRFGPLFWKTHKKNLRLELILAIKNRLKSEDEAERRE